MKAILFSTDYKIDTYDELMTEEEVFNLLQQAEDRRREFALRICQDSNVGLNIRKYTDHTEYFMDPNQEGGHIHEEVYSGVDDLRDKDHRA